MSYTCIYFQPPAEINNGLQLTMNIERYEYMAGLYNDEGVQVSFLCGPSGMHLLFSGGAPSSACSGGSREGTGVEEWGRSHGTSGVTSYQIVWP